MALIKCSNCGKEYSNLLSVCKHCKDKRTTVNEKEINEEKTYKNKDTVTQSKIIRKQTLIWVIFIALAIAVVRKRYQKTKELEILKTEVEKGEEEIRKSLEEIDKQMERLDKQNQRRDKEMERIDKGLKKRRNF